ncbi:gfo/Idh/MocA family oxidoreductase [bacterium]|nr:MAG: gfo/Idh/MocA family oxidoreductase [bacterium]
MISEFQADAIAKVPGARVVAFCDKVKAAADARAAQFGGAVYTNVGDLVGNPDIDAISICTPSGLHLEAAVAAAAAKKHVMVEKPIEVTLDRVDQIISACRSNGVRLGAIFPRRFMDSSQVLKNSIDTGRFGTIVLADVYIKWYRTQEYYANGGWRGTIRYDGGGALMNQGIHGIDLLQWLMGGVEKVSAFKATRAHTGIEVEDVAVASLQFRSGALGVIEGTTGAWPGAKIRIAISGSNGTVIMEDESFLTWQFRNETAEDENIRKRFSQADALLSGGASDPRAISSEGHRRQFEDFVAAIREDRPPRIDGAEARAAVAVITAIYRSATEHRVITVE